MVKIFYSNFLGNSVYYIKTNHKLKAYRLRDLPFHLWALEGQIYPSLLAFPEDLEDRHHQLHQVVQDCPIVKIMPWCYLLRQF